MVCASRFYPGQLFVQYVIFGKRAILLDWGPFSLRCELSSRARPLSLCFFMVLGHYPPGLRPIDFASCTLVPGLSIQSRCYSFILSEPVQFAPCAFLWGSLIQYAFLKSMRYPPESLPIQFVLHAFILEQDLFSLRIALSSRFTHLVCTLDYRAFFWAFHCPAQPSTLLSIFVALRLESVH